jgi:CheY-like chemotaxis protein
LAFVSSASLPKKERNHRNCGRTYFGRPMTPYANGNTALHVLVVEDHEDTAQSTAMLLALYGHEVHIASDGPTAVEAVQARHPDVVLLDLGLPKMDGWQVAKQLRVHSNGKTPFVIAVTGYGQQSDHARSHEAGIDLHLVKPVDPQMLQQLLRRFQAREIAP